MVADWILAIMYGGALCYLMLGLHMNMHKMIEAIDHITSSIRSISTRVEGTGLTKKTMVRVWNKAVANSSLVPIAINAPIFLIMGIEGVKFSQETQSQGGFEQNTQVESHQIGPSILLGQLAINGILYTSLIIVFTQREPSQTIKNHLKLQNRMLYYLFLTLTCLSFLWQILIVSVFSPGVIEFWEVLVTLLSIPIPQIVASYIVDRINSKGQEVQEGNHDESSIVRLAPEEEEEEAGMGKSGKKFEIDRLQSHSYDPIDFFRVLIAEKKGLPVGSYDDKRKRSDMRAILKRQFGHEDIEKVSYSQLATFIESEPLVKWLTYRNWLTSEYFMKRRQVVDRFMYQQQETKESQVRDVPLNKYFCFGALEYHYHTNNTQMDISVVNKRKINAIVGVRMVRYNFLIPPSVDDERTPFFERVLEMRRDLPRCIVTIPLHKLFKTMVKPDFEIHLELFDPVGQHQYLSEDSKTKLIAKPVEFVSVIGLVESRKEVHRGEMSTDIRLERKQGFKGDLEVKYRIVEIQGNSIDDDNDFELETGMIEFKTNEMRIIHQFKLNVTQKKLTESERQIRVDQKKLAIILTQVQTSDSLLEARLNTRTICFIDKVDRDLKQELKQQRLDLVLQSVEEEALPTWLQLIKESASLYPKYYSQDSSVDSISLKTAALYYLALPWRVILAVVVPPLGFLSGWLTLLMAIVANGFFGAMIIEVGRLFGCVTGLGVVSTGNVVIALGLTLPTLFAAYQTRLTSADEQLLSIHASHAPALSTCFGLYYLILTLQETSAKIEMKQGLPEFKLSSEFTLEITLNLCMCFGLYALCHVLIIMRRKRLGTELKQTMEEVKRQWRILLHPGVMLAIWLLYILLTATILRKEV
ncbi:hypothetical protein FGO68_gene17164 [Halteria grandinella]|uniref:Uncharacterized protein n=1 Tax=Halteria grandinella TaxID=5974 RepID=A0A8J8NZN2_HALGN|nr:hypothetical protein FGO68_gene17164 [Halteria grandinella]